MLHQEWVAEQDRMMQVTRCCRIHPSKQMLQNVPSRYIFTDLYIVYMSSLLMQCLLPLLGSYTCRTFGICCTGLVFEPQCFVLISPRFVASPLLARSTYIWCSLRSSCSSCSPRLTSTLPPCWITAGRQGHIPCQAFSGS